MTKITLQCTICEDIIIVDDSEDPDYSVFTDHLVDYHFPEIIEEFGEIL
jgi:hypothetical protein